MFFDISGSPVLQPRLTVMQAVKQTMDLEVTTSTELPEEHQLCIYAYVCVYLHIL